MLGILSGTDSRFPISEHLHLLPVGQFAPSLEELPKPESFLHYYLNMRGKPFIAEGPSWPSRVFVMAEGGV